MKKLPVLAPALRLLALPLAAGAQHMHDHPATDAAAHARDTGHAAQDVHASHGSGDSHDSHGDHGEHGDAAADPRPRPAHVPPPPAATTLPPLTDREVDALMDMDDSARFWKLEFDKFEWRQGGRFGWDLEAWFGGDEDRLMLRSEGERHEGSTGTLTEALWSHAAAPFWDTLLGVRHDRDGGPSRTWLAAGVNGTAPWWLDAALTAYVGRGGEVGLRLELEREFRLTQRLILTPDIDIRAWSRKDEANLRGSGVASVAAGLRLRYEIRREFAPYIGIEQDRGLGATARLRRAAGEPAGEWLWVAGVRWWY